MDIDYYWNDTVDPYREYDYVDISDYWESPDYPESSDGEDDSSINGTPHDVFDVSTHVSHMIIDEEEGEEAVVDVTPEMESTFDDTTADRLIIAPLERSEEESLSRQQDSTPINNQALRYGLYSDEEEDGDPLAYDADDDEDNADDESHHSKRRRITTKSEVLNNIGPNPDIKYDIDKIDCDHVFEHHVAAAKSFIINGFSSRANWRENVKTWDSLADTNWQNDVDVCIKAIQCGLPVEKLRGSLVLKNSPQDLVMLLQSTKKRQAKGLWCFIDEKIQCNKEVAFAALRCGIPFTNLPTKITTNLSVLKEGLENGDFSWKVLPKKITREVEFGLWALRSNRIVPRPEFSTVLKNVANKDRLWLEWACENPNDLKSERKIWREAPEQILSNSKLMLKVISQDRQVVKYIRSSLSQDLVFLTTALEMDPLVLGCLDSLTFQALPSLLDFDWIHKYNAALRSTYEDCADSVPFELAQNVPEELWTDREFVLGTWLKAGSPLHAYLPRKFYDDEEIVLTYCKHFSKLWGERGIQANQCLLFNISHRLKDSKTFLKKLMNMVSMDVMWSLIDYSSLSEDFELRGMVLSKWENYVPYPGSCTRRLYYSNYCTLCRNWIAYRGFFTGILCGIKAESSQLSILDQGSDASIKKRIASFLDFPKGELLTHLVRAAMNLNLSPHKDHYEYE